jgi:subtilisin family serine protease
MSLRSAYETWHQRIFDAARIAAPGETIITTYPFDTYSANWGTSFSAPFVAGGATLVINLRPNIAPNGPANLPREEKPPPSNTEGGGTAHRRLIISQES